MATLWAQVTLSMSSGYEDAEPTNTFWFQTDVGTTPYASIGTALDNAYQNLNSYMPGRMNQSGHTIKMYDLADDKPRAPVYETSFSFSSSPSGNSLPAEVALCLSFQGPRVSGLPQARRRGRVYLGPFDTSATDADGRPVVGLINAALTFAQDLHDAGVTAATWTWVVYSRVDQTSTDTSQAWCDNSFDTQRRRGLPATSRNTATL